MNKLYLIILLVVLSATMNAQFFETQDNIKLLNYLATNKKLNQALYLSEQLINDTTFNNNDSVNFLRGYCFYQLKQFDSACYYFNKVNNIDTIYIKSRFFYALNSLYNNRPKDAEKSILQIKTKEQHLQELQKLYISGLLLYERKLNEFNKQFNDLSHPTYYIANEVNRINKLHTEYAAWRPKSAIRASIYSAILPGLGKWYCNKRGQAIASFLTTTILSLIAAENISKNGWLHYSSILTGSAAATFYIGNIYGAYYQAKDVNKKYEQQVNDEILFNLHVALRNVYY